MRESTQHTLSEAEFCLPETHWRQFRSARCPGSPTEAIDHVVVGPTGINVITYVAAGCVEDPTDRRAARDVARRAANAVRGLLPDGYGSAVNPILCALDEAALAEVVDGVMTTSLTAVEQIVRSSPLLLSTSEAHDVHTRLRARLEVPSGAPAEVRKHPLRRRLVATAAVAAVAAGVAAFGTELAEAVHIW